VVKFELQDRDLLLLQLLSRCGAIKPDQAKIVYGTEKYHLKRIEKLVKEEVLRRDKGYILPTLKGLQLAGMDCKPLHMEKYRYKEHAQGVDLVSMLSKWNWTPTYSRELKQENMLQRQSRAVMTIQRGTKKYAVYMIADNPEAATIARLRTDLDELPGPNKEAKINMALIFCTSSKILETITNAFEKPPERLKSLCILPYPQGVRYFMYQRSRNLKDLLDERFPGWQECTRNFADFELGKTYITGLFQNDVVKRKALVDYVKNVQQGEGSCCVVICRPDQQAEIQENIPGVEVITCPL